MACGCGGAAAPEPVAPVDPTPLARCKVKASAESPLVTEWPASEKAHLESLLSSQAVAVAYSGCELRIVDGCKPSGRYVWRRTTLATDTLEIQSGDDLWAKLPLGAASLEGELGRTGRLAVRTTVSGQLALDGESGAAGEGACSEATHLITGISVGTFNLLSGGAASASGGVAVAGIGAGSSSRREEQTLRQAGDPSACTQATDESPNGQCASPIQLFLRPIGPPLPTAGATTPGPGSERPSDATDPNRRLAIGVTFPAPENDGEHWSLHDPSGSLLCDVPCSRAVPPGSGFYLERAPAGGYSLDRIDIPARLPHAPGSEVTARYRPERGAPFLSKLTFYGLGIPAGIGGLVTLGFGIFGDEMKGFFYGASVMYLGISAASVWWFVWSHDASFDTRAPGADQAARREPQPRARTLGLGVRF